MQYQLDADQAIARFGVDVADRRGDRAILRPGKSRQPQSRRLAGANAPEAGEGRKVRDRFQLSRRNDCADPLSALTTINPQRDGRKPSAWSERMVWENAEGMEGTWL